MALLLAMQLQLYLNSWVVIRMPRGGAREGAGRPLTGGELRKQRQLRATEEEWQIIREFSQILKKDKERAKRMLETE